MGWIILIIVIVLVIMFLFSSSNEPHASEHFSTSHNIDFEVYDTILMLSKVGLAFLSGSDGGFVTFVNNSNSIAYILNCKSTFFMYRDDLGISEDALLKQQGGGCPPSEWKRFVNCVNVRSVSKRAGAEELEFKSVLSLPRSNGSEYLRKLNADLSAIYPGINISLDSKGLSVIVTGDSRQKCIYR